MNELVKKVIIEYFDDNGNLKITETQTYKKLFEFNEKRAKEIAEGSPAGYSAAVVKAGKRGFLFLNKES